MTNESWFINYQTCLTSSNKIVKSAAEQLYNENIKLSDNLINANEFVINAFKITNNTIGSREYQVNIDRENYDDIVELFKALIISAKNLNHLPKDDAIREITENYSNWVKENT